MGVVYLVLWIMNWIMAIVRVEEVKGPIDRQV